MIILPFSAIPGPKPLPIIGNIWRYLPFIGYYKIDSLFENALFNKQKYGPIVREQITKKHTVLHLFDPEDIRNLLRNEGRMPFRRSHRALLKYRLERPHMYSDGGLFPENGANWYRQRFLFKQRMMSPKYVATNINKMETVSNEIIELIFEQSKSKSSASSSNDNETLIDNMEQHLYNWSLRSALSVFVDVNHQDLEQRLVDDLIAHLHHSLNSIDGTEIRTQRWVEKPEKCKYFKQLVESQDFLHHFASKYVEKAANESRKSQSSFLRDWLHEDKICVKDVTSMVMDCLIAGIHTTTYSMAFFINHIANSETLQTLLRKEVAHYLNKDSYIDSNVLDNMKLLRNSLKETFRISPVSIGIGRVTTQDLTIRGYSIPKGTMVIIHSQVSSIDPSNFKNPIEFNPDRWEISRKCPFSERSTGYAYLPFGIGSRKCIGYLVSELQMKVFMALFVKKFAFKMHENIKTKTTLIHQLDGPVKIFVRPLSDT